MANSISWGKIYDSTHWGIGVTSNTISWGKVYEDLAGFDLPTRRFSDRVEADGGVVEALDCVTPEIPNNDWDFYYRVLDDGGTVEALECLNALLPYVEGTKVPHLLAALDARSTYFENVEATTILLNNLENIDL